jgi:class 3 adenylate cyclase
LKESFERIRIVWLEIWKNKVKDYNTSIGLKCGMKTGYSIVGSIPTEEREEFTAIGSSASRLEGRATGNQIIVSSHTRERIQNQFNVKPIKVKVGEEIKAFEYVNIMRS